MFQVANEQTLSNWPQKKTDEIAPNFEQNVNTFPVFLLPPSISFSIERIEHRRQRETLDQTEEEC